MYSKWCLLSLKVEPIHEKLRSGRLSVILIQICEDTNEAIQANRYITVRNLHKIISEGRMATLRELKLKYGLKTDDKLIRL